MPDWLKIARESFSSGTTFMDTNYRNGVENNIRHFQNKHAKGSKYLSDSYKGRSRFFKPKTRSMVRGNEASAADAFFSNADVVDITAEDQNNPQQRASAAINKELLQYRLTKTIDWYSTLIGAFQESLVVGTVASYQYWDYQTHTEKVMQETQVQDEFGNVFNQVEEVEQEVVDVDEPVIELIPFENLIFDPGADWLDPVKSSPYVIHMFPMYVGDMREDAKNPEDKTGQPQFTKVSEEDIRIAMKLETDPTRQQRNDTEDPLAQSKPLKMFDIVWVHRNFVRVDGKEWVYYTLGTHKLISKPVLLEDAYFHGERPIVLGRSTIEAHKARPESLVGISKQMQAQANEISNQRFDNVRFVLNKRWIAKRNAQVDTKSLLANVPGGVTLANDPVADIREVNFPDVTSSSYNEQALINGDFDELTGNFSSGSVQSNRQLNETVGGMNILASGANQATGYLLRTFSKSWVEPVLRQMIKLEQQYETDEVILALAAESAQVYQKYGVDQVTDELLNQELTVRVNVGTGATDPAAKVQKFTIGMNTFAQIAAAGIPGVNMEEVAKEIFGNLGYEDGSRFINQEEDPKIQQLTQQVQQLTQALEQKQAEQQAKAQLEMAKVQAALQEKQLDVQNDQALKDKDLEFKYDELEINTALEGEKLARG